MAGKKEMLKKVLGELPLTAEVYQLLRQTERPSASNFTLRNIRPILPEAVKISLEHRQGMPKGKKVFLFASTNIWLEQVLMTGLALAGLGHDVALGYYPFGRWHVDITPFDIRRQSVYASTVLRPAASLIHFENLYRRHSSFVQLPDVLATAVESVTDYDFMYAFQSEDVDREDTFYQFRYDRNLHAARALYAYLTANKPEVAIVPNGTILEYGTAYKVCKYLRIPISTYEFSDKRNYMWLAHNEEVMQQNTDKLWQQFSAYQMSKSDLNEIQGMFASRKAGSSYGEFSRKWQRVPSEGLSHIHEKHGLDNSPVVLLATNVLGDSLTLGRNTFSKSMSEWIVRTIQFFIEKPEVQLIIRIHPGEALTKHGTILDLIKKTLPQLPPHIHLIEPLADVNTYDLMDVADLGLVYTTTVGLEMALRGIPVIVAGKTHYRNRGFTYDPGAWVDYFKLLNKLLSDLQSQRLTEEQVIQAWKYAFLFFFKYPLPFPWHMVNLKQDLEAYPMKEVLSAQGLAKFGSSFDQLTFSSKEE